MDNNYHLSNKKALFYNLKTYYDALNKEVKWWHKLPLTFHVKEGLQDREFLKFQAFFLGEEDLEHAYDSTINSLGKLVWIVKPGENTNRGCGIQVCKDLNSIKEIVKNAGNQRSYIIQKYIERPLLYKGRKFDIRCFTLLTCVNGNLQAYWYNDGFMRTSSKEFSLKNF